MRKINTTTKTNKKNISELPTRKELLLKSLQNKKEAQAYLQASLNAYQQDDNKEALLLALRNLAQAQGGMTSIAKKANMNREALYRTLSSRGNPTLTNFGKILGALGFQLVAKLS